MTLIESSSTCQKDIFKIKTEHNEVFKATLSQSSLQTFDISNTSFHNRLV